MGAVRRPHIPVPKTAWASLFGLLFGGGVRPLASLLILDGLRWLGGRRALTGNTKQPRRPPARQVDAVALARVEEDLALAQVFDLDQSGLGEPAGDFVPGVPGEVARRSTSRACRRP